MSNLSDITVTVNADTGGVSEKARAAAEAVRELERETRRLNGDNPL